MEDLQTRSRVFSKEQDLIANIRKSDKFIVIIGMPATGKTFLADAIILDKMGIYSVYKTDDYQDHGFDKSLYVMMSELDNDANSMKLVEGIQGARLLRKNQELRKYKIDLVIVCTATPEKREARYKERGGKGVPYALDKTLMKIYGDYLAAIEGEETAPRFFTFVS